MNPKDVRAAIDAARDIGETETALDIAESFQIGRLAELWRDVHDAERLLAGEPTNDDEIHARVRALVHADAAVRMALRVMHVDEGDGPHGVPLPPRERWDKMVRRHNGAVVYKQWYDSVSPDETHRYLFEPRSDRHQARRNLPPHGLYRGSVHLVRWWATHKNPAVIPEATITISDISTNRVLHRTRLELLFQGKPPIPIHLHHGPSISIDIQLSDRPTQYVNCPHRLFVYIDAWVGE